MTIDLRVIVPQMTDQSDNYGKPRQKKVGWVGANDGLLVLDRDFNQSADNGTELLGNPLVKDEAKGLRSLATWDANGDGYIDALDPVYKQLKVWQDFNQDGRNTHTVAVTDVTGTKYVDVQDQNAAGTKELRTLQELGITRIDYNNARYETNSTTAPNGGGNQPNSSITYHQISTINLQASEEGTRYTPVGAGIKIDDTDGTTKIVITQVQSEAAANKTGRPECVNINVEMGLI